MSTDQAAGVGPRAEFDDARPLTRAEVALSRLRGIGSGVARRLEPAGRLLDWGSTRVLSLAGRAASAAAVLVVPFLVERAAQG